MGEGGRSGAAPPVIIRVTAARARLRAACTRRDVLPREKSEHLSVPPRRQQPPTSLSNSTQLVTRSPNSYFLPHARPPARPHANSLNSGSGSSGQVVKAAGLRCRLQEMSACDIQSEMTFSFFLSPFANANARSAAHSGSFPFPTADGLALSGPAVNCMA